MFHDEPMKRLVRVVLFLLYSTTNAVLVPAHAVEKSPNEWITDAKAFYNRGTDYYGKGDYEAAIKDLSAAIALEPKAPDAYFNRGLSYRRQHKIEDAISDFSKAIKLYPGQSSYYFERCNAFIVKNDLNEAVTDCSEAVRLSPEAGEYFLLGVAHLLRDNLDEALADSVQALQLQPDYLDARRLLYETLVKREAMINSARNPSIRNEKNINNTVNRSANLPGGVFSTEKT